MGNDARRRVARLEKTVGTPVESYPSLSDLSWADVVARLPLDRMYPNNPELWGRA